MLTESLVCLLVLNLPVNNFSRIFINIVKFFSASKKYSSLKYHSMDFKYIKVKFKCIKVIKSIDDIK